MKKTKRQVEDDSALNIQATQFTTTSAICTQNPYQKKHYTLIVRMAKSSAVKYHIDF